MEGKLTRSVCRAPDVPSNEAVAQCLVSCECDDGCDDAAECGCQGPSELVNAFRKRIFAYTPRVSSFSVSRGVRI